MITVSIIYLLIDLIKELIQWLLFLIEKGLCWVIGFLNDLFEIAAGVQTVTYNGSSGLEKTAFINIFFKNSTVKTIYWGMALIGVVMCIGFTIAAVIRKSADSGDKVKQSLGDILTSALKSIVLILLLNAIITASVTVTNTLLDRVNYLFLNAQNFSFDYYVYFDENDYAAMARALNKIGNYSLNASYNSRYNLNSCYNDIRTDLKQLADAGKFDVSYITTAYDENGNEVEVNTWQSVLQSIYRSVDDISVEQPLDEYNGPMSAALLKAMDIIHNDASLYALNKYYVQVQRQSQGFGEAAPLDRLIMLIGSMYGDGTGLARGTGLTDYLRSPYYYGQKNIFDYDTVEEDFDLSLGAWNHLTVIIVAFLTLKEMLAMTFNAIARIFNMLLLYVAAPPFIAVTPLDEGQKAKQWASAFLVQSLGLFGTLMAMRLLLIFIPILFSDSVVLFEGARLDFYAKVIILIASIFTVRKASSLFTGILANNGAGAAAAAEVGNEAIGTLDKGIGLAKAGAGMAWGAAGLLGKAAGLGLSVESAGVRKLLRFPTAGQKNALSNKGSAEGNASAAALKNLAGAVKNTGENGTQGTKGGPQSLAGSVMGSQKNDPLVSGKPGVSAPGTSSAGTEGTFVPQSNSQLGDLNTAGSEIQGGGQESQFLSGNDLQNNSNLASTGQPDSNQVQNQEENPFGSHFSAENSQMAPLQNNQNLRTINGSVNEPKTGGGQTESMAVSQTEGSVGQSLSTDSSHPEQQSQMINHSSGNLSQPVTTQKAQSATPAVKRISTAVTEHKK